MAPMIIRSWCLGSSSVSRSVNWSMKLLFFELLINALWWMVYSNYGVDS